MDETGGPIENHRPVPSTDNRDHIMLYTSPSSRFELTTSVVIGTDCIGSCKSNYHTITATMAFSFSICLLLTIHYIWTFFILDISKYSGCFKCVQILYSTFCVQTISMIHFYTIVLTGFTRWLRGHCGRDCMVFVFTTTYAISAYHHWCCEFESRWGRGVQHYVITIVSDLRQVGGFLWVLRFPPPIKLTAMIWLQYCWKWR